MQTLETVLNSATPEPQAQCEWTSMSGPRESFKAEELSESTAVNLNEYFTYEPATAEMIVNTAAVVVPTLMLASMYALYKFLDKLDSGEY